MGVFVKPVRVERLADGGHAPVHHVAGRDDVGAGARVRHRRLRPATRASGRCRTSPSTTRPQCPWLVYSQLHTSVMTSSFGTSRLSARTACCTMPSSAYAPDADFVLRLRNSEQDHAADARAYALALLHQFVHRELEIARHGADLSAHAFARADEQRQDEMRRIELGFAHQASHRFGRAQAAHSMNGKGLCFSDCTGSRAPGASGGIAHKILGPNHAV